MTTFRRLAFAGLIVQIAGSSFGQNLVTNGDFSAGNSSFSSGYSFVPSGTSATPSTYGVRSSSQSFNPAYNNFGDHTGSGGLMMLVDGSNNVPVWFQTVSVASNAPYQFSAWAITAGNTNPASLLLIINGQQIGSSALPAASVWTSISAIWNSTTNTTATLLIVDVNPNDSSPGNDFALDDIALTPMPDFAVASVSWSGQPTAGESLAMSMVITNIGSASGANSGLYYQFVLSTNTTVAGAVPGGVMQFYTGCCPPPIAAGGSQTESYTQTLPNVPAGNYYLIGVADSANYVYESNETNNTLAVPITLGIPDFAVASVSWSGQAVAGQSLAMSMVITNIGSGFGASSGLYHQFVLSTNTTVAGAVPGGVMQFYTGCCPPPIAAGGSQTESYTQTLPNVPAGNYYLIGVADSANYVYESNEANNTLAVPITLGIPDFAVASVSWSGQPVAGQSLAMSMVITNIGSGFGASSGLYHQFVLSSNASVAGVVPGGVMQLYSSCCPPPIPAGGSQTQSLTQTLPNVPAGSYYLIGVADSANYVYESNEANNTLAVPITLGIPDFAVASVSWSGQAVAGQSLAMSMVITNIGSGFGASSGLYHQFVLSTNTSVAGVVPGGVMQLYSSCCPPPIPAGGSQTESYTQTLPNVPEGNYYLIGVADSANYVYESNEANNTLAVPITLGIPDFAVASVSWSGQPVAGQSLAMSMVITNIGSGFGASSGLYHQFVLSTNTTVAGVVPGGVMQFYSSCCPPPIPAGGNQTQNFTQTLPGVPAGNYYLIGVADSANYVYESNETNNTLAVAISIQVTDLVATNLGISGLAVAGTNLPFSFVVMNLGTNSYSSYWYDGVTLSTNSTLAGGITNWDFYGYHSLAPGGTYTQAQLIPFPRIAAGNYYLIAQADDRNYVSEANKTNNVQALLIFVTNRPPVITLLAPTNTVQQTSCAPVSSFLSAKVQLGSYVVTNVQFYDGATVIGSKSAPSYSVFSSFLDHGNHTISAQAVDNFGLRATSSLAAVSVFWPTNLNVLQLDLMGSNCVVCMPALNGSNYVMQTTTNLQPPVVWLGITTNVVTNSILSITNLRNLPAQFYRAKRLP